MKRLIPVLIVGAILALAATAGVDHRNAPVPAAAISETKVGPDALAATQVGPDAFHASHVKRERETAGDTVLASGPAPSRETPRQKARRIIAATWPAGQVENAMRVVKCESGFNQRALGDNGNSVSWFQIHLPSHPWVSRARARNNPWYATRAALRIWRGSGWGAWTCARILGIS